MGLFGKTEKPDPRKKGREISTGLRKEQRGLQRQINQIQREKAKVEMELKKLAKQGDKEACRILAKEIVNSKKAIARIHTSIAQLKSLDYQVKNQVAMVKVSGAFQQSTEVMKSMQSLVKVDTLRNNMMAMSKEMTKMGMMSEMIEDTMDDALDNDDLDDEDTQTEIDKVLAEITQGVIGSLPEAEDTALPQVSVPGTSREQEEDESEDEDMEKRLAALRG